MMTSCTQMGSNSTVKPKQVEIIGSLINQFNVKQAVADIGYGAVQVLEL